MRDRPNGRQSQSVSAANALNIGVYSAGSISIDALTVIFGNAPDNCYGG